VGLLYLALLTYFRTSRFTLTPDKGYLKILAVGVLSIPLTFLLNDLAPQEMNPFLTGTRSIGTLFLFQVIMVGVLEELAKYIIFVLVLKFILQPKDYLEAVIIGSTVALGFALYENTVYIDIFGWEVVFVRSIFSVPGHMVLAFPWAFVHVWLDHDPKVHSVQVIPLTLLMGLGPAALLHGASNTGVYLLPFEASFAIDAALFATAIGVGRFLKTISPFSTVTRSELPQTIESLMELNEKYPDRIPIRRRLGELLITDKQRTLAEAILRFQKYYEQDLEMSSYLGLLRFLDKEEKEARLLLRNALRIDHARFKGLYLKWAKDLVPNPHIRLRFTSLCEELIQDMRGRSMPTIAHATKVKKRVQNFGLGFMVFLGVLLSPVLFLFEIFLFMDLRPLYFLIHIVIGIVIGALGYGFKDRPGGGLAIGAGVMWVLFLLMGVVV
jgi:RsiW-degrading membrane proteinase PrsW (M82 family)